MYFVEMSSAIAIFFGLEEEGNLLEKKTLVPFLILCVSTLFSIISE